MRDASVHFGGLEATFVVREVGSGRIVLHNPRRAATRFVPYSTFKVPHAMIALETGVASGADYALPWDPRVLNSCIYCPPYMQKDQTLRSALQGSVVWYFQEMARRIGEERERGFIELFDYGNRQVGGPIDRFWLEGPLEISAEEQAAFLERFLTNRLGLSARTTALVREMLLLERTNEYTLSAKSGTGELGGSAVRAWLVGYMEQPGRTHTFALNMDCPEFEVCDHKMRHRVVHDILADWGFIRRGPG
jgi:beta-lactamase class D